MTEKLTWQFATFDELSGKQIYAILQARSAVFSVEQNCVYQDADDEDFGTLHITAWTEDKKVAAYCRIHAPNTRYKEPSIGRVLSSAAFRRCGLGRKMFEEGIKRVQLLYPGQSIRINAQAYLRKFYGSFGFEAVSEEYLEDHIPHVEMLKP